MLPTRTALSCLARSCCINAAVTARGMQQLGLLHQFGGFVRQRVFRIEAAQVLHLVSAVVFTRQLDMVGLLVEGNDKIRSA